MKTVIFNYRECRNSGMNGLLLEEADAYPLIVATDGVLAAHDLIEHSSAQNIGTVDDELTALGASWWIRGEYNDIRRGQCSPLSPIETFSHDLTHMADHIYHGVAEVPKPLVTYACVYDDDFQSILSMARRRFRCMLSDCVTIDHINGNDKVKQYFDTVIHYMRHGYRQASRRYKKLGQLGANRLFWNVATAIDEQLPHMDLGEQLKVKYCLSTGIAEASIARLSDD